MISRVLLQTIVAADLEAASAAWVEELGWVETAGGLPADELAALWGLDPAFYPRFTLLSSPQGDRGSIRILQGPADDREESFHRHGLFNAELLCSDVDRLHERLIRSDRFRVLCGPTTYDLGSTGGARSRSFATRGPGGAGVFFTTYLSVPPPRTLPRCDHPVCGMFNAALVAESEEETTRFFEGVLGMRRLLQGPISSAGINRILDLPEDCVFHLLVYKGEGEGLIEVDLHDHPVPARARSPHPLKPGNSFLSLECAELEGLAARAASAGALLRAPAPIGSPPYRGRRAALLRAPGGGPLELVEEHPPPPASR